MKTKKDVQLLCESVIGRRKTLGKKGLSIQDRFNQHVDKSGDCWNWTSVTALPMGHGRFWNGERYVGAHRFALGLDREKIVVRHMCNNPRCVRPEHLALGTQKDNMADKQAGPKAQRGEGHPLASMSNAQAKWIKELLAKGYKATQLAKFFQLNVRTIYNIKYGNSWSHI